MFNSPEFKTVTESLRSVKKRSNFILFCLLIFSLAGFYQILNLTIVKQENYITESNKNSIIRLPIYPTRGLIISAEDNSLLVENIVSQKLVVSIKNKDGFEDTIRKSCISSLAHTNKRDWVFAWR
jgi:cell division protein FtsI/penicillin-binding protein 2